MDSPLDTVKWVRIVKWVKIVRQLKGISNWLALKLNALPKPFKDRGRKYDEFNAYDW